MRYVYIVLFLLPLNSYVRAQSEAQKRKDFVNFLQCLALGTGDRGMKARLTFVKCRDLMPRKVTSYIRECERNVVPDLEVSSDLWLAIRKDRNIAALFYDCIIEKEKAANLDKKESMMVDEFKFCAAEVMVDYCYEVAPVPFY